jgi:hypothetical protein
MGDIQKTEKTFAEGVDKHAIVWYSKQAVSHETANKRFEALEKR